MDKKFIVKKGIQYGKGKDKKKKENACQVMFVGKVKEKKIFEWLSENNKFEMLK